jgi:pyruvate,water dikinase
MRKKKFILWFDEVTIKDVPLVGGKNASLGEMYQQLSKKGVPVPYGFAITAAAYQYFVEQTGIATQLQRILKGLKYKNIRNLESRGKLIRELFLSQDIPPHLKTEITLAYQKLSKKYRSRGVDVAVRSSATAEDLPTASFAGQQETFLNISGAEQLLTSCKHCFASLYTNRAIVYREENGFDHFKVYLSIGVQKMIKSESSGVMFTIDTESGFQNAIMINSAYGLGENVVQGKVNPDLYYVFKPTLKKFKPIIHKEIGTKAIKMIYARGGTKNPVKNVPVSLEDRQRFAISDDDVLQLARWGVIIEEHYTKKRRQYTPMDIEWGKDTSGKLYILQARPETVQSQRDSNQIVEYKLKKKGLILVEGKSVGNKIGRGRAHVIEDVRDIKKFREGEILVTEMTDPDWVPIMRRAAAIVTNSGGRTCHAAIVSRELGIPCIVGTTDATKRIASGKRITVSCAEGDIGRVYQGLLDYKENRINLKKIPRTKTKIMINLGDPSLAFDYSFLPVHGVGLAREEFIITTSIKIHPLALLAYPKVPRDVKEKIDDITVGYRDKKQFFVDKLAQGVATIGAAFYPHDVIVRLSDFKTNEYAGLIGGAPYEPTESNPMIGWRGASRYYHPNYRNAFALECKALKKVRDDMGLTNVKVMVPFCRTPTEGKKVLTTMAKFGLKQHKNGLEVYVMCEVPSNVILADEFCQIFDGMSIGSNDLTQLTLAVDRDSELIADLFDERNLAVLRMLSEAIRVARKYKKKIGICGQAPSDYPELASYLVEQGISSMSLNPDAVLSTIVTVAKTEQKMRRKR